MITFHIITIFPKIFCSYFSESILFRAQKKKLVMIKVYDLRDFVPKDDLHRTVDDRPYGGGPGMLFKIEPLYKCIQHVVVKNKLHVGKRVLSNLNISLTKKYKKRARIVLLTPTGKTFDQKTAGRFSGFDGIVLVCGRYEGFDARVEKIVDEKISIGNYVLSGGEVAAMVVVEAVSRLVPGVLGKSESLEDETFNTVGGNGFCRYIEYPQYTRPEVFLPTRDRKWRVPKVLLSGDHKKIREWKRNNAKKV